MSLHASYELQANGGGWDTVQELIYFLTSKFTSVLVDGRVSCWLLRDSPSWLGGEVLFELVYFDNHGFRKWVSCNSTEHPVASTLLSKT